MRRLLLRRVWPRRERTERTAPRPLPALTVPLVCALTSLTHEIADTEFTRAVSGRYRALCGALVAASPMCVPEGRRCENCEDARSRDGGKRGRRVRRFA